METKIPQQSIHFRVDEVDEGREKKRASEWKNIGDWFFKWYDLWFHFLPMIDHDSLGFLKATASQGGWNETNRISWEPVMGGWAVLQQKSTRTSMS